MHWNSGRVGRSLHPAACVCDVKVEDGAEDGGGDGVGPGQDHADSVDLGWAGVADVHDGEDEEWVPEQQEGDHHQQHHNCPAKVQLHLLDSGLVHGLPKLIMKLCEQSSNFAFEI